MRLPRTLRDAALRALVLPVLLAAAASPALAWSKAGHEVTGAIACLDLQKSRPATLRQAVALLANLPGFDRWQASADSLALGDDDRLIFYCMQAARWADDTRNTPYDHPKWHYVDFPYVVPGSSAKGEPPEAENLLLGFDASMRVLGSGQGSNVTRAMALAWVFHLVGDAHQPLHAAMLFSDALPKGDRGGNLIYVRTGPDQRTVNLHSFWDGLLIDSDAFAPAQARAIAIMSDPTLQRARLPELAQATGPREWTRDESFPSAVHDAYRDGTIRSGPDREHGEPLPAGYVEAGRQVASRRAALAGYRLADLLKRLDAAKELSVR